MAEAQRIFWRQTVLPLVERTAKALSHWLAPAFGQHLDLRPDLDRLPALATEREALWSSLEKTSFLTDDEKRAIIGYGPRPQTTTPAAKFNPHHIPAGNGRESGQFTSAPDDEGDGSVLHQIAKKPIPTKKPELAKPTTPKYKTPKSKVSDADGAKDAPSWAKGERPLVGEDGKSFAKRLLDQKYGDGNYEKGAKSEFSRIQKWVIGRSTNGSIGRKKQKCEQSAWSIEKL